jgi:hypothetical protein
VETAPLDATQGHEPETHPHIGSGLDDYLNEEGVLEELQMLAIAEGY